MELRDLPPFGDELLLLVLGPGFGESVLVRWPPNEWLVVDSCHRVADDVERHPAVETLRAFGGHPVAVALTHPHLDHTGGFPAVVARRREGALVGWLAEPDRDVWWATPSGSRASLQGDTEHALAAIDRVWRDEPGARWELFASDEPVELGELTIEVLSPAAGVVEKVRAAVKPEFNRASSAMLLRWRECELLLGADLTRPGWDDVEASHGDERFAGAHGYKVAHHASQNAQHAVPLGEPPARDRTVIATPYNKGHKVPSYGAGGDVERLLEFVTVLNVTTHHGPLPPDAATRHVSVAGVVTPERRIGRYVVQTDSPPKPLGDCWVAARFAPDGTLRELSRGAATMSVVAGP
jgi:hypothetical protein